MKKGVILLFVAFILSGAVGGTDVKELDLTYFKITVPTNWDYQKIQGLDSFLGQILTARSKLVFEFSEAGYAAGAPNDINLNKISQRTDRYIITTMWPKQPGTGITGIYFKGVNSPFSFCMWAKNLLIDEQEQALAAFKTITIPKK